MFGDPMTLKELAKKMGWKKRPKDEALKLIERGLLGRRLRFKSPALSRRREGVYQQVTAQQEPLWS